MTRSPKASGVWLLPLVLAAPLVAGCGGERVYPVEGKVVYKGGAPATDLEGYTIDFKPDSEGKTISATGVITKEGTFTLDTYKPGDGAIAGKHRVTISPPAQTDDRPIPPSPIHAKYGKAATSDLFAEIKAQRNDVTLEVERVKR